jgi:hypothetical protein
MVSLLTPTGVEMVQGAGEKLPMPVSIGARFKPRSAWFSECELVSDLTYRANRAKI